MSSQTLEIGCACGAVVKLDRIVTQYRFDLQLKSGASIEEHGGSAEVRCAKCHKTVARIQVGKG